MEFTELTTFIKSYIDACLLAIVEAGNSRKLSPDGLTEFERTYMQDLAGDDVIKQGVVRQLVQFINQTLITDDSIWQKLDGVTVAENTENKIEVLDSPKLGGELAAVWAKKDYVNTAVANLVNGAPAQLDALNELAAAINNDANFSATIINLIGTKLAASAYTAEDVFNKVKSLDVDEGGLNASTLQGKGKADFAMSVVYSETPLRDMTTPGLYRITDQSDAPAGCQYGLMLVISGSPVISQLIMGSLSNRIYWRSGRPVEIGGSGDYSEWREIYNSTNLQPESGKVKSTSDDTAGYLGEKLGDGLMMGNDKKATLDFSKVLKNEGFNSSMLKIPVQFIKNKELDIRLPYTNYEGNPYGVGTPLLVTNVVGNVITISNVPYVEYLFNDLQTINWWNMIAMNKHTGEADSILGFTNTGAYTSESAVTAATYGGDTSTFTVLNGAVFTVGDTIALHSARNKYFKFYPDVVYNMLAGGKYAGIYGVATLEQGSYIILAQDQGNPSAPRCNVFTSNKLAVNYTQMTDTGRHTVLSSVAAGFDAALTYLPNVPIYSPDLNGWLHVAWGTIGGVKTHKVGFIDKFFTKSTYYPLNISYSKTRTSASDAYMVGFSSMMYHNGLYYLVVTEQEASYKTPSQRWILTCYTSKTLQGKFTYHSTVTRGCDWRNNGIPSSSHNTNGWMFTHNSKLYYWATVTGRADLSGSKAKIVTVIYVLNDQENEWEMLPTSMILNPRYTGGVSPFGYGTSASWAKDHIGHFGGAVFEEGKIKLYIAANNGTDTYQGGYAEMRLYDSSPEFTVFGQ